MRSDGVHVPVDDGSWTQTYTARHVCFDTGMPIWRGSSHCGSGWPGGLRPGFGSGSGAKPSQAGGAGQPAFCAALRLCGFASTQSTQSTRRRLRQARGVVLFLVLGTRQASRFPPYTQRRRQRTRWTRREGFCGCTTAHSRWQRGGLLVAGAIRHTDPHPLGLSSDHWALWQTVLHGLNQTAFAAQPQ